MSAPLNDVTRDVSHQYDRLQVSIEKLARDRKKVRNYLNYGYTNSRSESYEQRQENLCAAVFDAAEIQPADVIVDVGFGSGEQDFFLARTRPFASLTGFNISARQVEAAARRAAAEGLSDKLRFELGEAEALRGVPDASVDKLLAIECAFYFDRERFYARAAQVLKPGGRVVLADIAFDDRAGFMQGRADLRRVGTRSSNRRIWERHFRTHEVRCINRFTRPGTQLTVREIIRLVPGGGFTGPEVREWAKLAFYTQLVALGQMVNAIRYDLVVLEKPAA